MKRIKTDMIFEKDSDADEVWRALKNYAARKNLRNLATEKSYIELHECHHDDNPPKPCVILERFEN